MVSDDLTERIDEYLNLHWDEVLDDIDSLVCIESVEDLTSSAPQAPYGSGPRAALDCALGIAERMGLAVHDCEGYIGYADLVGSAETQVGIIGHVDVVPAGPGWTFDPYAVTRKDGYLMGRGVFDDKGPIVVALHAVRLWHDKLADEDRQFPYTVRVLFGVNEETNMKDVAYYRERYADPAFLFTPDAEFPVCYGEAGICSGTLTSALMSNGVVSSIQGGVAVNAVPGQAHAVLKGSWALQPTDAVSVEVGPQSTELHAQGKSAHASTPAQGENAMDILAAFLLDQEVLSDEERAFFELVRRVTSCYDGSGLGVVASDEHFGDLTAVGGMATLEDNRFKLSIDFRYPTTISSAEISRRVQAVASEYSASFEMQHDKKPFLMNPESEVVQALLSAYNESAGENAKPFTMKGGTYARMFTTGASFGPEKPWEAKPDWVGGMHGPDEGVSEELLKQAFGVYVRTIGKLMELDLE